MHSTFAKNNVTFEQATIEDLDIPAQSLDAVLGLSILHLLRDFELVYQWQPGKDKAVFMVAKKPG
jgi:hypothetical protein